MHYLDPVRGCALPPYPFHGLFPEERSPVRTANIVRRDAQLPPAKNPVYAQTSHRALWLVPKARISGETRKRESSRDYTEGRVNWAGEFPSFWCLFDWISLAVLQ
jgi:hypothetical protein